MYSILVTAVCLLACSVREGAGNAINLTEVKNTLESTSHVLGQMQQALQEMSHVEKKDMGMQETETAGGAVADVSAEPDDKEEFGFDKEDFGEGQLAIQVKQAAEEAGAEEEATVATEAADEGSTEAGAGGLHPRVIGNVIMAILALVAFK